MGLVTFCLFPFDRHVTDFSWLLAHGVVMTAERLVGLFVSHLSFLIVFVVLLWKRLAFCSLSVPWPRVFWPGFSLCLSLLSRPLHPCVSKMCCLVLILLCSLLFPWYIINLAKHRIWLTHNDFRFRSQLPSEVDVIASCSSFSGFFCLNVVVSQVCAPVFHKAVGCFWCYCFNL